MKLSPDTKVGEALASLPGAKRALFAKYHIGGCSQCAYDPEESLAGLCERNENLPVEEVIAHLEKSAEEDAKLLLEPAELAKQLEGENRPILVDVRTREEFDHVHLDGSRFFTADLHQEIMGSWEKGQQVVYLDHSGDKALDAAAFLVGHGFTEVKALRGGIDAYSREVDPSIKRYRVEIES